MNNEHQVVVLKNETRKIKLAVIQLKEGTAATITKGDPGCLRRVQLLGTGIDLDDHCRNDKCLQRKENRSGLSVAAYV